MDTLSKLFGSAALVKIMKLFLMNPDENYQKSDVVRCAKVTSSSASYELRLLESVGMIKKKSFFIEGRETKSGKVTAKKRVQGFCLDKSFKLLRQIRALLIHTAPIENKSILSRLSKGGQIKIVVISGVFIQDEDSRVDVMIVGDRLKEGTLKAVISTMESEIGKQLRYVILETQDFKYRVSICDRLVRDILDYPHNIVVDKTGLL